jgi:alanine dehydrogenase
MLVGVPREVKNREYRVALTPAGVVELVRAGHTVLIERAAGEGSSIPDADYVAAGARIVATADDVWRDADLVLKVKEPIAEEYGRMRAGQTLFTYLHLAASKECTDALTTSGITAIAYEAKVVVIGAGVSGMNAAAIALGMQAEVIVLDRDIDKLRSADRIYQGHMQTVASNSYEVERAVLDADLVIGAVLVPGAKAPVLVSNELVSRMKSGSVLVDIAVDQGGCFEDTRPTTHDDPTFRVHESVFYCVANMPGAVPNTSTHALTNVTLPYVMALANEGTGAAVRGNPALAHGVNVVAGQVVLPEVAEAHGMTAVPWQEVLV